MKKFILVITILTMALLVFSGCAKKVEEVPATETEVAAVIEDAIKPVVTIEFEGDKKIEIELYPSVAPNTVNNFISLVDSGFYDGVIFHRVIKGFMIQGGDPDGIGTGGPGYGIAGEFTSNDFQNDLAHTKGVISMARSNHPDSAGSQFFIMHQDSQQLDGKYAAFGKVITGLEFVDEIAEVETNSADRPLEDVVMKKVTVDLKGFEAKEPVKAE